MNYDYEKNPGARESGSAPPPPGSPGVTPSGAPVFPAHNYDPRDYMQEAYDDTPELPVQPMSASGQAEPLSYGETGVENLQAVPVAYENAETEPPVQSAPQAYVQPAQPAPTQNTAQDKAVPWWEANRTPQSEPMYREPVYREVTPAEQRSPQPSPYYTPPKRDIAEPRYEPRKRERRRGGFLRAVCLVLVCAVVGAAGGIFGTLYAIEHGSISVPNSTSVVLGAANVQGDSATGEPLADVAGAGMTAKEIYKIACKQVVSVMSEISVRGFFGQQSSVIYGSGFIISEDGYILTNHHVIADAMANGADINVVIQGGETYKATVIGFEEDNDVAVIKIEATGLTPVKFGSSADMSVGDNVYAVGNPRRLDYTMTEGIVSALDRVISVEDSYAGYVDISMFQISAAVNSGNSGGPVYNERGEVIGIVSAKYMSEGAEGLGFAIPIDDAIEITSQLIQYGYVSGKASIGIDGYPVDAASARYYHMVVGVIVDNVYAGSAAEHAGLEVGDIITKLGDVDVIDMDSLKNAKRAYSAGDTTTITVWRDGEYFTYDITFDEEVAVTTN